MGLWKGCSFLIHQCLSVVERNRYESESPTLKGDADTVKAIRGGVVVGKGNSCAGAIGAGEGVPNRRKIRGELDNIGHSRRTVPGNLAGTPWQICDCYLKERDVDEYEVGITYVRTKQR